MNDDCEASILPQTVLSSYDNVALSDFDVILKDELGIQLPSNNVGIDFLDQNLTYELVSNDPDCNQSCHGNVLIEYKFLPIIDCPSDITLSCGGLDVLPLPDVSGGGTCVASTLDIYLADEVRVRAPDCDPDYTFFVTRTYEATDGNGNTTSCEQTITLRRPDFRNIVFPQGEVSISCSETDRYIFDEDGIPLPWVVTQDPLTGIVTDSGVPIVCEPNAIYTTLGFCSTGSGTGSGTPLIPDSGATIITPDGIELLPGSTGSLCNSAVIFSDLTVPTDGCSKKVYRTWEILEWFCSTELAAGPVSQLITVVDDVAPEFTCPADFTMTTDDDCGGAVELPGVTATDACSNGITYSIFYGTGSLRTNGGQADLNTGLNMVTYVVSDNCNNSSSCEMMVTVRDLTEPVAICEHTTTVSLTCLLYTSPSPRDATLSRMPSSA